MIPTVSDPTSAARFLAKYVKDHGAGAFGAPTAKEIAGHPEMIREWTDGDHRVVAVVKLLSRYSKRTDYCGRDYGIPAGSRVVTHLAATPGSPLPDLSDINFVYCHLDDRNVAAELAAQDRSVVAVRVSATAELIGCWARGRHPLPYGKADLATFTSIAPVVPIPLDEMRAEVERLDDWYDDFPLYSDGTWSALTLRGYEPSDPQSGVKPSEMPRKWREEHPDADESKLDWTVLAPETPAIRAWVEAEPWWSDLERVRLFRMAARDKGGRLGRHSDIADKAVGTRDGQLVRFHIPIITHPDVKMTCWGLDGEPVEHHMAPGSIYYLDTRKPHSVANLSPVDRVHLVVDAVVTPEVRDRIARSLDVRRMP